MLMCVLRVFVCLLTCSHVTVGLLALFAIDLCIIFKCPLHVTCPQHLCDAYNFMAPFCILSSKITAVQFQKIVILQTADSLLKIKISILSPNGDIFFESLLGYFNYFSRRQRVVVFFGGGYYLLLISSLKFIDSQ